MSSMSVSVCAVTVLGFLVMLSSLIAASAVKELDPSCQCGTTSPREYELVKLRNTIEYAANVLENIAKDDLEYLQEVSNLLKYEGEIQELADSSPSVELQAFQVVLEKTTQEACSLARNSSEDEDYNCTAGIQLAELKLSSRDIVRNIQSFLDSIDCSNTCIHSCIGIWCSLYCGDVDIDDSILQFITDNNNQKCNFKSDLYNCSIC